MRIQIIRCTNTVYLRSAGNNTPIYEPVTSHACLPYELPVAMPQGIVSDVLRAGIDAGIKHGEVWLQVHTSNTCIIKGKVGCLT